MTPEMMYSFAKGQVEWYEHQNEFIRSQIQWCTRELKATRKEDKEIQEYALSHDPDELTLKIFSGKYVSSETRKLINERNKYYREIKHNQKRADHYRREAEYYGARMNSVL